MEFRHQPVMVNEVIEGLRLKPKGIYVDCTIGGGGHSQAILDFQPDCQIIGIDQDPNALQAAERRLAAYKNRVSYFHSNFLYLDRVLIELGLAEVDGILLDLGVSSAQLDQKERGFSYQHNAKLDMRMDPSNPKTAYDLVNNLSIEQLTEIISKYGEERWAKRIAEFIDIQRKKQPIETTSQLTAVIKAAIPRKARLEGPHPASRTFQALRIAVNDELKVLQEALHKAVDFLKPEGRLCVISFHSLEDRIVKTAFKELSSSCICPPGLPICGCNKQELIKIITRKPLVPDRAEISKNPRARSAKLRVCERLHKEEV